MIVSESYVDQLKFLHRSKVFGDQSKIQPEVKRCIDQYNVESILDFGCGKGNVIESLKQAYPNIDVYGYDPSNELYNVMPQQVDLIFSTDVIEHIEPEYLDKTIDDLANRAKKVMHHLIACHPAKRNLPDGRNAHLIIEEPNWWKAKLQKLSNWTIVNEEIKTSIAHPKKGPSIQVIKYLVTMEKNNE
jgi:cyclopropane fatty-acyl-phospholipid synthase-like methyltransferase